MGSGDRITSYGCDGSESSHLVRLKRLGPWPNHGIICALLNDPNFVGRRNNTKPNTQTHRTKSQSKHTKQHVLRQAFRQEVFKSAT